MVEIKTSLTSKSKKFFRREDVNIIPFELIRFGIMVSVLRSTKFNFFFWRNPKSKV